MRLEETERIVSELESGLQRAAMDADRRLTQQQQKYEQKIQLLMRQLMENEARPRSEGEARSKGSAEDREKDKRFVDSFLLSFLFDELSIDGSVCFYFLNFNLRRCLKQM